MTKRSSRLGQLLRMVLATATAVATVLLPRGGGTAVLAAAGDLDPTFGIGGKVTTVFGGTSSAGALALQPDGKLVAAGESDRNFGIVRYLTDGSLDGTFGAGGMVTTDFGSGAFDRVNALVLQPDGKLVAAGMALGNPAGADFGLVRYLPDGSLDSAFGTGGKVTTDFNSFFESASALVLQPDGKLVAAGGPPFALARYNPDGSLDVTFGTGGQVTDSVGATLGTALVLQPDGALVVAGWGSAGDFLLTRYNPDGSLDSTFGTGGKVTTDFGGDDGAFALVQQPDGKLVAAGGNPSSAGTGPLDFLLARYNPDGSLDVTFGTGGKVTTDFTFGSFDRVHALVLQPDGRLVAAGLGNPGRVLAFVLARYHADGSLDDTFGSLGQVVTGFVGVHAFASALLLQPDSKLVAAGSGGGFALARYLPGEAACVVNTLAALPNRELALAGAADRSSSFPSSAASGSRGAGRKRLDPAAFRRLRDLVLVRSPGGRRYAALYAAHSPEVVRLMLVDPALRAAILDGLLLWQANVAALAAGRGAVMTVTAEQSRAVDAVVDQLAKVGSHRLRRAIQRERRAHPPGLNFAQAVLREIAR